ncbi:phosphoribosylamine--glycine ligase [Leptospira sp. GIMC2001]|uniref:phosphoribosylamine--glycine ligase n=1 Tax=Leptospira sp. GIMC2001 TaxID=1513297 RepID=UPI0023499791|nr:phosphoribosylamine--glycine ligase [Leptospira sp. GIMC2001]WCL49077.1 phosphoribosylamine--glycine ligase [Leptospira sp. GIMC2001]
MNKALRVLLLGSGGREHAIADSLLQSPLLADLKVYPGNGGFDPEIILPAGTLDWKDKEKFQNACRGKYDFVFVGPEDPLVAGVSDWLQEIGIPCFGPSAYCAQIEGSKDFAKKLMMEANVPTAKHKTFYEHLESVEYVRSHGCPIVIKADGLAAGKGVTVCLKLDEAEQALNEIFLDKKFGASGSKVVIEDFLEGEEASIFAICDGKDFLLLPAAQDHKRAYDNDEGPNTGGMGAYCPAPIATSSVIQIVEKDIVAPILQVLKDKGKPYVGILYVGLMINAKGLPSVVEFNCRFGDPETQAVLQLLEDDLLELTWKAANGQLSSQQSLRISEGSSSIVVLAAEGYPNDYKKDITLNIPIPEYSGTKVFHAGTKRSSNGNITSTGGRILGITTKSKTLKDSIDKTYSFLNTFSIPFTFYRKDIGRRAL